MFTTTAATAKVLIMTEKDQISFDAYIRHCI